MMQKSAYKRKKDLLRTIQIIPSENIVGKAKVLRPFGWKELFVCANEAHISNKAPYP